MSISEARAQAERDAETYRRSTVWLSTRLQLTEDALRDALHLILDLQREAYGNTSRRDVNDFRRRVRQVIKENRVE